MALYTAQYRYSGPDRVDITVKAKVNEDLAPTWDMVNAWKNGPQDKMAEARYTVEYFDLLSRRHAHNHHAFWGLHDLALHNDITIVCFCPKGAFCHRVLLAAWMEKYYNTTYGGER